jgi:hypothetical protein
MVLWDKGKFTQVKEDKVGEVTESRETKQGQEDR